MTNIGDVIEFTMPWSEKPLVGRVFDIYPVSIRKGDITIYKMVHPNKPFVQNIDHTWDGILLIEEHQIC